MTKQVENLAFQSLGEELATLSGEEIEANSLDPIKAQEPELAAIIAGIDRLPSHRQWWLSGYLQGRLAAVDPAISGVSGTAQTAPSAEPAESLTILYGSQTGNAEAVAKDLAQRWQASFGRIKAHSLARFKFARLAKETRVLLIVSTHGEGDPPDSSLAFFNAVLDAKAPTLENLSYAVIGLGDSSYKHFCKPARDLDERLAELGAKALLPRLDCDLDYQSAIAAWENGFLAKIETAGAAKARILSLASTPALPARDEAEVLERVNLCLDSADKRVWHLELGSELPYQCGDAVAIVLPNPDSIVNATLALIDPESHKQSHDFAGESGVELQEILSKRAELYRLNRSQIKRFLDAFPSSPLASQLSDEDRLDAYIDRHSIPDLLASAGALLPARQVVDLLLPITDRLYSIASSPSAHPGEIHITVREQSYGLASPQIAALGKGQPVEAYIKPNPSFRLARPEDDIILVGAGTGIAPYRSFLAERLEQDGSGARGRSWLFFGEQSFHNSFLYQLDWQYFLGEGVLDKISLAFSRDQARKIYVHHRMLEESGQVLEWIQSGATIYVCGDRKRMAADVNSALIAILAKAHDGDEGAAQAQLAELAAEGRYQRDVY